ncbi:MAG: hypothetical protein ABEJ95_07235 [Candidatus Nanohalobium sp.]
MKHTKTLLTTALILLTATTTAELNFKTQNPINFHSNINMQNNQIQNLSTPVNSNDAVRLQDLGNYVNRSGDTMNGYLNMNGNNITAVDNLKTGGQNITVRDTKNNQDIMRLKQGGNIEIPNGNLDMGGNLVSNTGKVGGAKARNWGFESPSGKEKIDSGIPGWRVEEVSGTDIQKRGGNTESFSFGFESCCNPVGDGAGGGSTGQWDVYKTFSGNFGDRWFNASVKAYVNADVDGVGSCSSGNVWVGENGARITLRAYDSSGNQIGIKRGHWTAWHAKNTAGISGDGDKTTSDVSKVIKIYNRYHLPSGTKKVRVNLNAGENSNSCTSETSEAIGNAATYFDSFELDTKADWTDYGGRESVFVGGGNLDMNGNNIALNGGYLSNDGDNEGITIDNSGNVQVPSGNIGLSGDFLFHRSTNFTLQQSGGDDKLVFWDEYRSRRLMSLDYDESGPLKLTNTALDMNGNNINNVNSIELNSQGEIQTDGTNAITIDSGQNVAIPNGNLDVSSPSNSDHTVDVGGSMGVEGNLDLNSNAMKNVDWSNSDNPNTDNQGLTNVLGNDNTAGNDIVMDGSNNLYFGDSGDSGRIQARLHNNQRFLMAPYDDGSEQWGREFGYSSGTNQWYVENGLDIKTGGLDMNSNDIKNIDEISEPRRAASMNSVFHDSFEDNSLGNWARVDTSTGGSATGIGTGGQVGANPIGDYLINMEGLDMIEYQANIDLSSLDDPVLSFYWACRSCDNEGGYLEISQDGGSSWTQIETFRPQTNSGGGNSNFQYEEVDLSAYGGQGDIRIRFKGSPGSGDDFAVDNINIHGERGLLTKSSKTRVSQRSTLVAASRIDAGGNHITNVADPNSAQDAATMSWVNNNDASGASLGTKGWTSWSVGSLSANATCSAGEVVVGVRVGGRSLGGSCADESPTQASSWCVSVQCAPLQ